MSEWKRYKLSDLYEMSSGISSTKEQAGHGSPFLSFSVVFNNYFLPDNLIDLMDTTDGDKQKYSINEGDIFLTRTSETVDELAMSSVALKDYPEASFSGFLKRLRPVDKRIVYPKFMAFYLRSPLFRRTIINNTVMTLRASFNEVMFSYLEIMLPDFDTQKKIGDFLYSLEKKKQTNNQINQELEAMAKTLYDYWFVQFDFPDQNGNPYKSSGGKMVYNPELKREIPEGWGVESVGNLLDKVTKAEKIENNSIEFIGKMPVIDQSQKYIAGFTNNENGLIQPQKGHVIFGDHTRVVKYINFDYARGADGTQVLISKNEHISNVLLYHMIKDFDLSNYGYARHFKFLKEKIVIVPDKEVSSKFETQANVIYEKIKNNIFENQELTQLRDWLLPMLMNGQVKVE
ncbi:putative type-1 restriction enzyme MjaXP specificity protein [Streptococcus mitis]|uniref:Putative type-1 restriction enzyme MjaXP specificity protein n=1 Tax=Streptococcus mitis TaxID=28037 RepID=A0A4V0A4W9_STRMT|nr:restriction endonuclease subunit S [Streptococcus mitis]VTS48196.1 putative type-1 restriction enzyme MjaXP specificity protein [Streptococcus mitis]